MADETFPAWDLVRTAHGVQRGLIASFEALELSPVQFGVLAALRGGARLSQAELAREVLITPQSMNTVVGSFLSRGLVAREAAAGRGGRTGLALTDDGHEALDRALPDVRKATAGWTLGLNDDETTTLVGLLAVVRASR